MIEEIIGLHLWITNKGEKNKMKSLKILLLLLALISTSLYSQKYFTTPKGINTLDTSKVNNILEGDFTGINIKKTGTVSIGTDRVEGKLYVATEGAENFFISDTWYTSANGGGFALGHSRGTILSPTGLSSGDNCGSFYWRGMRSNGTWTNVGRIQVVTEEALTTSAIGCYMGFEVGTTGSGSRTERMRINGAGNVGIGYSGTISAKLDVNGAVRSTQFKLSALNNAPTSATDTGTLGEIRIDANYIYVCTATNTWKRAALVTWP